MREARALWMLEFYPAIDPPDDDVTVFASDGKDVEMAAYRGGQWWKLESEGIFTTPWPEVIGWADLPDAEECVKDLLPDGNSNGENE